MRELLQSHLGVFMASSLWDCRNECFSDAQIPEPFCVFYNRAAWSWGALAVFAAVFMQYVVPTHRDWMTTRTDFIQPRCML